MIEQKPSELDQEQVNLVIARLKTMPDHIQVNLGGEMQPFDREKLIAEIKKGSEIGKEFVQSEIDYLRSLKEL